MQIGENHMCWDRGTPPAPDSDGSQQIKSVITREQTTSKLKVLSYGADDVTNKEGVLLGERDDPVALIRWNTAHTKLRWQTAN
ncbi:hypothetical protein Tco_1424156 [Tanacetum coccineum]